jgi:hypothetical protein
MARPAVLVGPLGLTGLFAFLMGEHAGSPLRGGEGFFISDFRFLIFDF